MDYIRQEKPSLQGHSAEGIVKRVYLGLAQPVAAMISSISHRELPKKHRLS